MPNIYRVIFTKAPPNILLKHGGIIEIGFLGGKQERGISIPILGDKPLYRLRIVSVIRQVFAPKFRPLLLSHVDTQREAL